VAAPQPVNVSFRKTGNIREQVVVAAASGGGGTTCNGGCDPTNVPGYSVTSDNNLLGSITHDQKVVVRILGPREAIGISGIT
jgi:hypothetical protein